MIPLRKFTVRKTTSFIIRVRKRKEYKKLVSAKSSLRTTIPYMRLSTPSMMLLRNFIFQMTFSYFFTRLDFFQTGKEITEIIKL